MLGGVLVCPAVCLSARRCARVLGGLLVCSAVCSFPRRSARLPGGLPVCSAVSPCARRLRASFLFCSLMLLLLFMLLLSASLLVFARWCLLVCGVPVCVRWCVRVCPVVCSAVCSSARWSLRVLGAVLVCSASLCVFPLLFSHAAASLHAATLCLSVRVCSVLCSCAVCLCVSGGVSVCARWCAVGSRSAKNCSFHVLPQQRKLRDSTAASVLGECVCRSSSDLSYCYCSSCCYCYCCCCLFRVSAVPGSWPPFWHKLICSCVPRRAHAFPLLLGSTTEIIILFYNNYYRNCTNLSC